MKMKCISYVLPKLDLFTKGQYLCLVGSRPYKYVLLNLNHHMVVVRSFGLNPLNSF